MKTTLRQSITVALVACATIPAPVLATNGYFGYGWGTKSKAMAGVAAALPQDTLVSATNPAGMAFVGNSLDLGISFFNPTDRGYEANDDYAKGPAPGCESSAQPGVPCAGAPFVTPGRYDSDGEWFLIPSLGYNRELDSKSTIGVSVYGNGGMNTDYREQPVWGNFAAPANLLVVPGKVAGSTDNMIPGAIAPVVTNPGPPPQFAFQTDFSQGVDPRNANPNGYLTATTPTGISLEQLFIEIPYTYKIGNGKQSVGIAPVFAAQSFEAKGLQPFRAASVHPDKVTNNGKDWSYGFGLHVGWYGEINDQLALGAAYRSQMWMTDFEDYEGLFASGGEFDIPATFNLGLAYKVQPNVTLAFDYQHIFYDEIDALSNSNDKDLTPCFAAGPKPAYCLGGDDGLGFGWESQDIFKLGLRYDHNDKLSFLGGVSYNTEFSSGRQALFNVLAPATVRWHLTLGATYRHSASDEFNIAFAYMPEEELDGTSPSITQSQSGSIYMEQKEIEVSWSHRF